jgi:glycosyltransferase involved in cell wall biosynthesis
MSSAVDLSIVVATRNRASSLASLFESLENALAVVPGAAEIIVIDNGSSDDTSSVIAGWRERLPRLLPLFEERPGKSRALNRGLQHSRSPLLGFLDDDVRVVTDWIATIRAFFHDHPEYAAAAGRVRLPPEVTDPELLARVAAYRSLPLYDGGDAVREHNGLAGCNMALRRSVFDIIGPFNERLGPGASGAHEDADLVVRIRAAKLRIGYMPGAIVYHAVDPERFTPASFRAFQRRMARSTYLIDPVHAWRKSAGRLPGILIAYLWWSLLRHPKHRDRTWGRLIKHAEVLRLRWRDGCTVPPPLTEWHNYRDGS